ncbi:MAG: MDR family MFS transporter [Thermoplasmatota archaeon]
MEAPPVPAPNEMDPNASSNGPAQKKGDGLVLAGIMLGVLLYALDSTVVGPTFPKIIDDIGGLDRFTWVVASYLLASTVMIPIASKLSDLYGRRPVLLAGYVAFLVGSILCGFATDINQLILFRGIQGLGGGVIFPVALATIADLYPPADRGKVQGLFGAVFGLSSVIGPFAGGWIVDNVHISTIASWRWAFFVNLPVGLVAIGIVALHFPRLGTASAKKPIDVAGMVALSTAIVSALLVTIWGGDTYDWVSVQIIGLAALSVVMFGLFVWLETRAADPIIPLVLFKEPIFTVSVIASLLLGVGLFGALSFLPTFMQGVVGITATYSGLVLTPMMLTLVVGSQISGRAVKRVSYKWFALVGCVILILGYFWLSLIDEHTSTWTAIANMLLLGLGLGFTIQMYILATQNAIERRFIGVASGALTLARNLGATFGVSILGVILNDGLQTSVPANVPQPYLGALLANPQIDGHLARVPQVLLSPTATASLPPPVVDGIKTAFTQAVSVVFFAAAVIAALALLATIFLKRRAMKTAAEYHGHTPAKVLPPGAGLAPQPTMSTRDEPAFEVAK